MQTKILRTKKNINKNTTRPKTQKGGKKYHTDIKISYNKNSELPLICSFCKKTNFKIKTQALKTKFKGFINPLGLWSNRYKLFSCQNCGHVEMFSNNIRCNKKKCDKNVLIPDLS